MAMNYDKNAQQAAMTATLGLATLKETKAARKAQDAYNSKKLELEKQGLGLQADQIAKQYAMQQAQLEWDKQSFAEQFGQQVKQADIDNAFRDKELTLNDTWRTAEQTGFRDGVPTLAKQQLDEQQRQFNTTAEADAAKFAEDTRRYGQDFAESQRQFNQTQSQQNDQFNKTFGEGGRQFDATFGEGQRQFNVGQVMGAARGPADWAAYTAKLRGLQSSGAMPGAVGTMFDASARPASYSNGGQETGHVLTNTELAMGMTGLSDGSQMQGTAWQGMRSPAQQVARGAGSPPPSTAAPEGQSTYHTMDAERQPQMKMGTADVPQQSQPTGRSTESVVQTNSANPYGDAPAGGADAAARLLGTAAPSQTSSDPALSLPSAQKFRKYAPTEQAMGLGYLAENGGPTEDDAKYLMDRQSPNYARSRAARYSGI